MDKKILAIFVVAALLAYIFGNFVGGSGCSSTGKVTVSNSESLNPPAITSTTGSAAEKPAQQGIGKIEVTSHSKTTNSIGFYGVVGEVKNNTSKPATYIKVVATFYNAEGTVVGTNFTYVVSDDTLAPSTSLPFEISNAAVDFASYKLDVRT